MSGRGWTGPGSFLNLRPIDESRHEERRGDGDDGDDGFVVEPGFVCPLRRKTNGIVLIVSRHEREKRRGEGV